MGEKTPEVRSVRLSRSASERMANHAEESYPHECFGFLLGHFEHRTIRKVLPGHNTNVDRPHDRYEMDPQEFLQAQKDAEQWAGEVIGFYHSHPNDAACPSAYDRQRAWAEYLYLIIPVWEGKANRGRVWQLASADGSFSELGLECTEKGEAGPCPS